MRNDALSTSPILSIFSGVSKAKRERGEVLIYFYATLLASKQACQRGGEKDDQYFAAVELARAERERYSTI